jgi:fluoroquinolone transport system permease protein
MSAKAWRALAGADSQILWRDPLLGWVLLLPLSVALMLRVLIPPITGTLAGNGFQLEPFYPLVMSGYLMTAPGIVGMVVGFLLLDERDARTLSALRVTPLSVRQYLAYRVTGPLIVGTLTTLVAYPLAGLEPMPLSILLPIAAVGGLSAPTLALVLAIAAPNKVAGFAVVKVLNLINLLPLLAYFVPMPAQLFAGILPAFWPMRAFWAAAHQQPILPFLIAGVLSGLAALLLAVRLFEKRIGTRAV